MHTTQKMTDRNKSCAGLWTITSTKYEGLTGEERGIRGGEKMGRRG